MKKGVLLGSLTVLLMFCSMIHAGNSRDVKVINGTGLPIKSISLDQSGNSVWNENEISATFQDKEKIEITVEGIDKGCQRNMKVVWADNNAASIYKDIDLCKVKVLTLKYDRSLDAATFITE